MFAYLLHFLFFASVVLVACGTLSLGVRWIARRLRLTDTRVISRREVVTMITMIAGAGPLGQGLFTLLAGTGWHPDLRRGLAWAVVGGILAAGTSRATPYMPRRRSLLVGMTAGMLAGLAFHVALQRQGEEAGRLLSALMICATLPFAVLFPLSGKGKRCVPCLSGRGDNSTSSFSFSGGTIRMPTPGRGDAPGRVPVVPFTPRKGRGQAPKR